MQLPRFLQSLLSFRALLPLALCVTKRNAFVQVINNIPHSISVVGLSHKYSDVYNEKPVTYNTGAFTTGRDWWRVFGHNDLDAIQANSMTQWYSDPDNFRSFFDFLEKAAPSLIGAALTTAGLLQPEAEAVVAVTEVAAEALCEAMLNDAANEGYKQHILREEDEGKVLQVWINDDGTINFMSGRSDTVYSTAVVGLGLYWVSLI